MLISNVVAWASAVINFYKCFEPFLIVELGGTERIVAISSLLHWVSFGYLRLELFDRLRIWFLNPVLSDWYSVDSGVATARDTLDIWMFQQAFLLYYQVNQPPLRQLKILKSSFSSRSHFLTLLCK